MPCGAARQGRDKIFSNRGPWHKLNNAGTAGPRQPMERVPLNAEELAPLRAGSSADTETLGDAMRNILGLSWNQLRDVPADLLHTGVLGDDLEAGIDAALQQHGVPTTSVSTPFVPLPDKLFPHPDVAEVDTLSPAEFRQMVQDNLTHQFRVALKASLMDGTQLVLVSPDVPATSALAAPCCWPARRCRMPKTRGTARASTAAWRSRCRARASNPGTCSRLMCLASGGKAQRWRMLARGRSQRANVRFRRSNRSYQCILRM